MSMIIDGSHNDPVCRCDDQCEMPCWQLVGLTEDGRCGACGCAEDQHEECSWCEGTGDRYGRSDPPKTPCPGCGGQGRVPASRAKEDR